MSKFKLTQTAAEVQNILNNSLQKPTGLAKTKLVGVGVNGQENIEIGDNLTLANGKLAAAGGGVNGLQSDAEGNLTVEKNLGVDGKLTLKSLVSESNPDGDITKELGGGGGDLQITNKNTIFPIFKFEAKAYNIGDEVNLNDNPIISYTPDKGEIMRPYAISASTPSVIKLENNALIFIVIPRFYYSNGSDGTVYKTTYRAVCIKEGTLTSSQIISYTGNTYKVSITN